MPYQEAKKNCIVGEHDGALRVAVTAAPEKGKANPAVIETLANALGLRAQIMLIQGKTNRDKKFLLRNIAPELTQLFAD